MFRTRILSLPASFALAWAACGCTLLAPQSCPAGLKPMTEAELLFGRGIAGGGTVGDADWRSFLDAEVTPRFPDGLTVEDASGQWKDAGGIVRESSKRLVIVLPGTADDEGKLSAIRQAYKARFRQDAVLVVETKGCGSF